MTMCIFVPTQWDDVCASPAIAGMDRQRLRVAMWGASPATLSTLELMARTFPGADIVSAYGQTEMSGATTLLKGPDATRKMGSVGRPMVNVELRLVDDRLQDVAPGRGGRDRLPRADGDAGLPRARRTRPRRHSPAAGSTAATWRRGTRRATCGWSIARRT